MDVNRGTSEDLKKDPKTGTVINRSFESVLSEIDHFIKIEGYDHE